MTSKQRAYLKSLAMTMDPIFQIGKGSLTPAWTIRRNLREPWQNAPIHRLYRLSAKKSFFIKKEKTTRKKSNFHVEGRHFLEERKSKKNWDHGRNL